MKPKKTKHSPSKKPRLPKITLNKVNEINKSINPNIIIKIEYIILLLIMSF